MGSSFGGQTWTSILKSVVFRMVSIYGWLSFKLPSEGIKSQNHGSPPPRCVVWTFKEPKSPADFSKLKSENNPLALYI